MIFAEFRNALCILTSIDEYELVEAGVEPGEIKEAGALVEDPAGLLVWESFSRDPYRFLLRADDKTAAKIWSIIVRRSRQPKFKATEALRIDCDMGVGDEF